MNRLSRTTHPALYLITAVTMLGVFYADTLLPLGVAVWIVYMIPVGISLSTWNPRFPILTAAGATGLMLAGYYLSPPGIANAQLGVINRAFGVFTVWCIAGVAFKFIAYKIVVARQDWIERSLNGLGEATAGDLPLAVLGDRILGFLVECLDAQIGAFYVRDAEGLERVAGYALPSNVNGRSRLDFGEGLVGQSAIDGRFLESTDAPSSHFQIVSGTGESTPKTLFVVPAAADGQAQAVIELAFFRQTEGEVRLLLERVSNLIGITTKAAIQRRKVQELLEETQRQAEELQVQSEELRVSNEELEEQGLALQASQQRLEEQQQDLEAANVRLEEQRDDLIRAKTVLEEQSRELERASRYKSEFLANMSHELRTPLNSTLILAKLLADNADANLTEEQVKFATTIHSAGTDLLNLINDILDLSKVEAGHVELDVREVTISHLLASVQATFEPLATQKAVEFVVELEEDCPTTLVTDAQRLEQILRNLLSNAFKFTEAGGVRLTVAPGPKGLVRFQVSDSGIGIPSEQLEAIFQAFRQADSTTSRKYGGTGLGLSISRELARRLGGEIDVESEEGRGSRFTLVLPIRSEIAPGLPEPPKGVRPLQIPPRLEPAADALAPRSSTGTGSSKTVLVVEDDPSFSEVICDLVRGQGFGCECASTTSEALSIIERLLPHAVLLDVALPDHDGLAVLDRLKQDPRTRHIPVHVLSGTDHAPTAYSLGASGFLLKPLERDEIVRLLEHLGRVVEGGMRRVLVVEDDPVQLDAVQKLIQTQNVETVGAANAAEAVARLEQASFDCIVLDLSLPDRSGLSLLDALSQQHLDRLPPVIVYTGRELSYDEELELRRYSKSIIVKGAASPERLLDEVTLFLHQVVSDLPPERRRMVERSRNRDRVLEGKRILVTEDDVRNVFAVTSLLEPKGVEVLVARNGLEALQVLEKEGDRIDLILMDVMMPEMDGLTAMREIRQRNEFKKLPIIALTAKAMLKDREQCLEAGANDYIAKPLDGDKLLSLARVWISRR